jgi:protein-arginine deiminase
MRFRSGLIALLLLSACGQNFAESFQPAQPLGPIVALPLVDLRADVNRNGVIDVDDPTEDANEDTWDDKHGAVFLANIDDDTGRCPGTGSDAQLAGCNDALDEVVNGGDDVLDLAPIKVVAWPTVPTGTSGSLTIAPTGFTRMFRKVGESYEVFEPSTTTLSTNDLRGGVDLFIEGKDILRDAATWDGYVTLTLTVKSPDHGQVTDTLRMRMSPVMTFHHLTPPETSYVTRVFGDPTSTTFVNALKGILQATPEKAPLVEIRDDDIWTQDFFETGYMSMPGANGTQHVVRVAFRSANVYENSSTPLRPAGRIVFTRFRGRDSAGVQAFELDFRESDTLNSYGNTETIPPFEHNGQKYPLGRMLRGEVPSFRLDPVMKRVFEAQGVQPPVYVDTSWLLVAHVDETISFLKAPNARGWVLLLNDPRIAKQMLEAEVARGNGNVRMFIGKAFYDENWNPSPAARTISQVLADTNVMSTSARAAAEIDAQLEILKRETGITEAEIIRVPFLHHTEFGAAVAWQPGFVNGYVAGLSDFIAPDPFGPVIDGKDIFKADFESKLTAIGYNVRWIDDWDLYHVGAGEVHCGTNAARKIPEAKWWESGR